MLLFADLLNTNSLNTTEVSKVIWVTQLLHWIIRPRTRDEKALKADTIYSTRIKFLTSQLERDQKIKKQVATVLEQALLKLLTTKHIAYTGMSPSSSFQHELFIRFEEKILPGKPLSASFESLLLESFPNEHESLLIDQINIEILHHLIQQLEFSEHFQVQMYKRTLAAGHRLSLDLVQISEQLREDIGIDDSDLYSSEEFFIESRLRLEVISEDSNHSELSSANELLDLLAKAEKSIAAAIERHLIKGIKVDVVYGLQNYKKKVHRLQHILKMLQPGISKYEGIRSYLSQTILDVHQQRSLISFLKENFSLLISRIVQTNSAIGEHYVTYTWKDFMQMFYSSLGGGAITSLTVMLKFYLGKIGAVGFIKGVLEGLNYSTSFLLIQTLGFTLATKQPSATALHLGQALKKSIGESRRTIVALLRTQFIAVLGNFIAVSPLCFLLGWIAAKAGHPLYSAPEVSTIIDSSSYLGFAPLFATITGVLLFISSLIAGWFENFSRSNSLPSRIQENPSLINWIGLKKSKNLAIIISNNASAIAGNFSLGILLGLVPQFVKFLGIPLEVRHITLAAGSYFSALYQALQNGVPMNELLNSFFGLFIIGLLNISVSFFLAFLLASIATKVSLKSLSRILFWGTKLILTKPWLLLVPEKTSKSISPTSHP